jgi:hypothetical protein
LAVGLTLIVPVAAVEVKVPGVMAMLVAPVAIQLSVLLEPEVMLAGSAVNEAIVGAEPVGVDGAAAPHPIRWRSENPSRSACDNRYRREKARRYALVPGNGKMLRARLSLAIAMFWAP